ncbi:lipopolysaccharide biosynthesis protein [Peristeroidobacter agariperforans]|uniref:lipopolysaccharide biosynthesis protein n=1 Tax=Peristeroidobacter agariperforans TaxID=268404 RepID=UPI0022B84AE6|nr:oligosaccharide flippase family protein [Peristeroidobacter agariperforans]
MSITRFMNQGLVVISPILLVRLLTVEEFGRYREFLLYAGLLTTICAFGINNSLLYFIPSHPNCVRQMVRQAVTMTFGTSVTVVGGTLLADYLSNGAILAGLQLPVAIYVLLFVNLDFWEFYWLSQKRPVPVFAYTTGRLIARILVVVTAATIWRDVMPIVWCLIALEALRISGSWIAWRRASRNIDQSSEESCWSEQFRYCWPVGLALILVTLNKSLGNLFVTKTLGVVALAHYAIGTHIQPVIGVLRNSVSDAVLPELAALKSAKGEGALALWRRSTVVSMILLTAAGVVLFEFAHTFVVTLFSASYEPAVVIFQIYLLVLVREVFDFGVALRAVNKTAPIVTSSLFAILLNLLLLVTVMPIFGLPAAALAFVISRWTEGLVLSRSTMRAYNIGLKDLARWGDLGKVALAAALASTIFYGSFWTDYFGLSGVVLGSAVFMALFLALLLMFRVPELTAMLGRLRKTEAAPAKS